MTQFYTFTCGQYRITGTLAAITAALPQWVQEHTTPESTVPPHAWQVPHRIHLDRYNPKRFWLSTEPTSVLPRCIIRAAIAATLNVPQRQVAVTRIQ